MQGVSVVRPDGPQADVAQPGRRAARPGRCGCGRPPGWSVVARRTGPSTPARASQRGTVTASVPPGLSTRASSAMAVASSGRCSRTSAAMTRSNVPSGKGRARASPRTATPRRARSASPAPRMAPSMRGGARRLVGVPVQGDHVGAGAVGVEGVPAAAAAEVEHPVARDGPEPVEVDGQHGRGGPGPLLRSTSTARYCSTVARGRGRPREPRRGPAPGLPAPIRSRRSASSSTVEMALASAPGSPGGTRSGGSPSPPHHLGQRPAGGGHERHATRHGLDGGKRETLVERGHDGHLGLGVQLDQRGWSTWPANRTAPSQPEPFHRPGHRARRRGAGPMTTSSRRIARCAPWPPPRSTARGP